jgi:hypothetical protein
MDWTARSEERREDNQKIIAMTEQPEQVIRYILAKIGPDRSDHRVDITMRVEAGGLAQSC